MPVLSRRGFTLIELMIALLLLGIVATGIYRVLVSNQQIYLAQTQRIDLQQNIRAALTLLPADFREIDAADGDILKMAGTSITIRARRSLAFICNPPVLGGGLGGITMTVRQQPFFGSRVPFDTSYEGLWIYYEGNPTTRTDDSWVRADIKSIQSQNCPGAPISDGAPGYQITLDPFLQGGQLNVAGAITNGAPVYSYRQTTYSLYQSGTDSRWYLGLKDTSNAIQPIIGPLIGSNGLEFRYYDVNGNTVTDSSRVALIEIRLRAQTQAQVRSASTGLGYQMDSVVTSVALRNNARCGPGSLPFVACN